MDTKNNNWPIGFIVKIQNDINTEPDYQRPLVWPLKAKQLLIDSILRNYDIPKFYLDKKNFLMYIGQTKNLLHQNPKYSAQILWAADFITFIQK